MKEVISHLEPKEVFRYFEILSSIPRGSGHEEKVSNWFVNFAKERNLEVYQDKLYNILIKKPGTPGYESSDTVILHGHMDMVCKKEDGVQHDFLTEGLDLKISGDYIEAEGTTLGADNGIGISYFLALLDSDDIPHPPIEMVLTVMEEMGKVGGNGFDTSLLTGKWMIDLNWHLDDHLLAGCGGDVSVKYSVDTDWKEADGSAKVYKLNVSGLIGGHCEFDIVLERANSIKVLGRLLNNMLHASDNVRLAEISGGVQNNVIPSEAEAVLLIPDKETTEMRKVVEDTFSELQSEYSVTDPQIQIDFAEADGQYDKVFSPDSAKKLVYSILNIPNGVISMSFKIKGISECSNNIGIMRTEEDKVTIICTITSGVTTRKHEVMKQIYALADLAGQGVKAEQFGCDAPEWEYNENSHMLTVSKKAYKEVTGEEPYIEVMPASLELGLFQHRIEGLDIISIGTETHGVHSSEEKLGIGSVGKVWKIFKKVLEELK